MKSKNRRQFRHFVDQPLAGESLTLEDRSANYLTNTLRLGMGAAITLFDGKGTERRATITALGRGRVQLTLGEDLPCQPDSPLSIRLIQGLAKGEAMDAAIQKATELGVTRIAPVTTQYSVVKLPPERAERRLAHWENVCKSACEQCGRHYPPVVDGIKTLAECLADLDAEGEPSHARLMLDPTARIKLPALDLQGTSNVSLLIGPEGGLSRKDRDAASAHGFIPCSLGPRILRTETAAMAACAILQTQLGDLK